MTVSLKHTFQSTNSDGPDSSQVQPTNWNEEHVLTAAAGKVLGRDTSGNGVVQELPIAVTAAGNVGLGTTTPGQKLTVAGTIESTSGGVKFPDGTTQTTAAVSGVSYPQNAQNGNYTLVLADAGKQIYSTNTAVQTITIPTNASVAFPIGTLITIINRGTSPILLGTTGVSVIANGSAAALTYNSISPNNAVQLLKTGTNTWDSMFGTIAATLRTHLIVAGGGGGGTASGGGGGGAGGLVTGTSTFAAGTLTVTIGAGGSAGGNGVNSSVTGLTTAVGGGAGGANNVGVAGGSGGGAGGDGSVLPGGAATSGQGNAGGASNTTAFVGAGGGGASAVGATGVTTAGGAGGAGTASTITGSSVTYAGGGGGGQIYNASIASGGNGGGGAGGSNAVSGVAGTANRGGGGGGSGTGSTGAAGGSGVVIISSPIAAISTTGSPTITTSTGNTIYTFNSSGTITF